MVGSGNALRSWTRSCRSRHVVCWPAYGPRERNPRCRPLVLSEEGRAWPSKARTAPCCCGSSTRSRSPLAIFQSVGNSEPLFVTRKPFEDFLCVLVRWEHGVEDLLYQPVFEDEREPLKQDRTLGLERRQTQHLRKSHILVAEQFKW